MSTYRTIGLVFIVVGIALVVFGIQAGNSLASEVKEAIEGTPTDRSMLLIIGGVVVGVLGLGAMLRGRP